MGKEMDYKDHLWWQEYWHLDSYRLLSFRFRRFMVYSLD